MNLYLKYKNPAILLQIEELEKGGAAAMGVAVAAPQQQPPQLGYPSHLLQMPPE